MVEKKKSPAGSGFWQIVFPASVSALLVILLGGWFVISTSPGNLSRFAEISTVLLVVPVYIIALVFALLLVGLIYLVGRVRELIPRATGPVLRLLERTRQIAGAVSRNAAGLIIIPTSLLAGFRRKNPPTDQEIKIND